MSSNIWQKFIEKGLIIKEMLTKARQMQKQNKSRLGFNLALLGADEETITKNLLLIMEWNILIYFQLNLILQLYI